MREFVRKLEERGDVLRVDREIDPAHELAAVTQLAQKKWAKPVLFTNVKGTRFPVISNVYSTRERLGEVIGIDAGDFCRQWSKLASLGSSELKEPLVPATDLPAFQQVLAQLFGDGAGQLRSRWCRCIHAQRPTPFVVFSRPRGAFSVEPAAVFSGTVRQSRVVTGVPGLGVRSRLFQASAAMTPATTNAPTASQMAAVVNERALGSV